MHIPVMVKEVEEWLNPRPGCIVVDATLGVGGHAKALLRRITPGGVLFGFEVDPEMLEQARVNLSNEGFSQGQFRLFCESYTKAREVLHKCGERGADGIVLDAGICTEQVMDPGRGFSFSRRGPLDARFSREKTTTTAADIVNKASWNELADIFYYYGDERKARRIAREIVRYRDKKLIETTEELADVVAKAVGGRRGKKIHEATRVFQALRIAVNKELEKLERGILTLLDTLLPEGRFVVISYHSGEDRIAKNLFRSAGRGELESLVGKEFRVLTKKPLRPRPEEVRSNPRSRSARLRAISRAA